MAKKTFSFLGQLLTNVAMWVALYVAMYIANSLAGGYNFLKLERSGVYTFSGGMPTTSAIQWSPRFGNDSFEAKSFERVLWRAQIGPILIDRAFLHKPIELFDPEVSKKVSLLTERKVHPDSVQDFTAMKKALEQGTESSANE